MKDQSPRRIPKIKIGALLETAKQKELMAIHDKLKNSQKSKLATEQAERNSNPYAEAYEADMRHWSDYCDSMEKYETAGVNLKWPYYFTHKQRD